jgi:hypothetical protein
MRLTKNFELWEFVVSQTAVRHGLDNTPSAAHIRALKALCENILQPLRDNIKRSIVVSSGYRSPAVNTQVGGSSTSQHCKGQAADFNVSGLSVSAIVERIQKLELPFDQLIDEYGAWVHVSFRANPRGQVLKVRKVEGKNVWTKLA